MAKKKSPKVATPKARGRPATGKSPLALQMRGPSAWKEWLEGFAQAEGVTSAGLVDRALQDYAAKKKHPQPPSRI